MCSLQILLDTQWHARREIFERLTRKHLYLHPSYKFSLTLVCDDIAIILCTYFDAVSKAAFFGTRWSSSPLVNYRNVDSITSIFTVRKRTRKIINDIRLMQSELQRNDDQFCTRHQNRVKHLALDVPIDKLFRRTGTEKGGRLAGPSYTIKVAGWCFFFHLYCAYCVDNTTISRPFFVQNTIVPNALCIQGYIDDAREYRCANQSGNTHSASTSAVHKWNARCFRLMGEVWIVICSCIDCLWSMFSSTQVSHYTHCHY